MRKRLKGITVLMFACFLGIAFMNVPGEAATKVVVKKVHYSDFTLSKSSMKKPATLKKGKSTLKLGDYKEGSYVGYHGYVKFKAPKTKNYTLTFSNLQDPNSESGSGYVQTFITDKKFKKGVTYKKVSTQGGKNTNLNIGEKESLTDQKKTSFLTSRYGKLKLKKGETLYLFVSFIQGSKLDVDIK
jgi:hypothetical protein